VYAQLTADTDCASIHRFDGFMTRLNQFIRESKGVPGMLERLLAELVGSQVISLAVRCDCGFMCMDSKIVQFCGSIMYTLRHRLLLAWVVVGITFGTTGPSCNTQALR
jgi:hypothetical protein